MDAPVVIGWDVETPAIEPGCLTPPLVVATFAGGPETLDLLPYYPSEGALRMESVEDDAGNWKAAFKGEAALDFMVTVINAITEDKVDKLVAHYGNFDWGVLCNEWPDLMPVLTTLIETGKISDTFVREKLICNGMGNFVVDTRRPRSASTGKHRKTEFGLDYLVMTYFKVDISADKKDPMAWRLRYGELVGIPLNEWPAKALDYALQDAVWARLVWLEQAKPAKVGTWALVHPDGAVVNEVEQVAAAWALHLMACHGVYTDAQTVEKFEVEVTLAAAETLRAATAAGFWRVNKCKFCEGCGKDEDLNNCHVCNGLSHEECVLSGVYPRSRSKKPLNQQHKPSKNLKRLKSMVHEAFGGFPEKTDKGNIKTGGDVLLASGNPLLVTYAEGVASLKLLNTYLPILEHGITKPITSSPNVLVRSGRTSWARPNFQNPPRKGLFRKCFIPRVGKVFSSIDYKALEMTTLAQVCLHYFGHSKMAQAINAGKDLHVMFAAHMLAAEGETKSYGEWMQILSDPANPLYKKIKTYRQRAKAANFGFPGGLGVDAFVTFAKGYGTELSFNEASDLKALWLSMWPEMSRKTGYFKMISDASNMSTDGRFPIRQLYSNRVRGGCSYTSGANTYFQGLAADGAKAAMWALYKACYLGELPDYMAGEACHLTGVRMWAFVHDEFLFEGDEGTAHLWAPQASRIMVEEMRKYTPDVAQAAPPALMRRWEKDADEVYNDNGDLIPWEE